MNIYEITGEYLHLQNAIENGEISEEEYADMLECMDFELEGKVDGYAYVMKNIEADIKALKEEADKLTAKRKGLENRLEKLKAGLLTNLEVIGKKEVKGSVFGVKVRQSKAFAFTDEDKFYRSLKEKPELYAMYVTEKTTLAPKKDALKKAMEGGEKFEGAAIAVNKKIVVV